MNKESFLFFLLSICDVLFLELIRMILIFILHRCSLLGLWIKHVYHLFRLYVYPLDYLVDDFEILVTEILWFLHFRGIPLFLSTNATLFTYKTGFLCFQTVDVYVSSTVASHNFTYSACDFHSVYKGHSFLDCKWFKTFLFYYWAFCRLVYWGS